LELVGEGSFGAVWKAWDTKLARFVALKIPRNEAVDAGDVKLFLREARAAANLKHANIVKVFATEGDGGVVYIASEFIDGSTLGKSFRQRPPSPHRAAEICAILADALQYAHEQGIIHRDLKPANIMVDGTGQPHIMDFGLAKHHLSAATLAVEGEPIGTPAYMSPEQARGEHTFVDGRSDVYALGVVFFELLTGERPFRGDARVVVHKVIEEEAPLARRLKSDVPLDLENICAKCLEKEPSRRYATAGDFAADLRRYMAGEPVKARPVGAAERLWRWCRRKPVVAILGGLATALAAMVIIGAPVWAAREVFLRAEAVKSVIARRQSLVDLLKAERGQWKNTLRDLDEAEKIGGIDPVVIGLERVRAFDSLNKTAAWVSEIDALAARKDLGAHKGEVLLWQANRVRATGNEDEALELTRQALAAGLPPADTMYAQALLADSSPEVVTLLRKALVIDPFHRDARVDLCGVLLLSGSGEESTQLAKTGIEFFAEDPSFPVAISLQAAINGNKQDADRWLQTTTGQLDKATVDWLKPLISLAIVTSSSQELDKKSVAIIHNSLLPLVRAFYELRQKDVQGVSRFPFRIPRPVLRSYEKLFEVAIPEFMDLGSLFANGHAKQIEALEECARRHPDGIFHFLRAQLLDEDGSDKTEDAYVAAASSPSLLPKLCAHAWLAAAAEAMVKYVKSGQSPTNRNRVYLKRGLKYVHNFTASTNVTVGRLKEFLFVFEGLPLQRPEEFDDVRKLLAIGLRAEPENTQFMRIKAAIELKAGDYQQALHYSDEVLKRDPKDEKAKKYKAIASDELKKLLGVNLTAKPPG
jgi:tetratricopeptide (TPR) repeat protein